MELERTYRRTFFSADIIKEAILKFDQLLNPENKFKPSFYLTVEKGADKWWYDTEDEFFSDYRESPDKAKYSKQCEKNKLDIHFFLDSYTLVSISAGSRTSILGIFEIFEKHLVSSRLPELPPAPEPPRAKPKVFIGHGRNSIWKELKDHLHEKHGYEVVAYEIGTRAGHTIRDILDRMLAKSTLAFLVMTGEDKATKGESRARDNVIHELGLFQGRLGFHRAIVLLEKGTKEFSNIQGIQQIRFKRGNIKETFGEVVATINREFPPA